MTPLSLDFVVPCGRPDSAAARRTFASLAAITRASGARAIVVGGGVRDPGDGQLHGFEWIDTGAAVWPSAARNLGASRSAADLLAFVDDDCTVPPDALATIVEVFARDAKLAALSGRIRGADGSYLGRSFDYCGFSYQQSGEDVRDTHLLVSAFLVVRRDAFLEVGGFDAGIRISEDVDLVCKLLSRGLRTLYLPAIEVTHHHGRDTWRRFLGYQYANGRSPYLLERNHPSRYRWKLLLEPLAPVLLPALLAYNVIRIVAVNVRKNREVLYYLPGIVAGRFAFEAGRAVSRLPWKRA